MNYNQTFIVLTGGTALADVGESNTGISLQDNITFIDSEFKTVTGIKYIAESTTTSFKNVVFTRPLNLLSENLELKDLYALSAHLQLLDLFTPQAIIIVHGTDRLCFSAAYIALTFNRPYPILFVSCQRSLDRPTSELNLMLHNAITITTKIKSGCWVLNYVSPTLCELINPKFSVKLFSYGKSCFASKQQKPCFSFNNISNTLTKFTHLKLNSNYFIKTRSKALPKILVLILFPDLILPNLKNYDFVIICGTGLGNISQEHIALLDNSVVFVISVPIGPTRNDIYITSRNLAKHSITQSNYCLDYLYLSLLTKSWTIK